jgi:hypothetical protein
VVFDKLCDGSAEQLAHARCLVNFIGDLMMAAKKKAKKKAAKKKAAKKK